MSFCKSCKAEVRWIQTRNGKHMPADKEQQTIITEAGEVVKGYTVHWQTCPTADQHREPAQQSMDLGGQA